MIDELGLYYALTIEVNFPKCNLIFGPSYKSIPLCISSAIALSKISNHDIGYFFNRKEEKNYGDNGFFIRNSPSAKDSIIMVDDVITCGHTKIENIKLIRKVGKAEVKGIIVSLDRMEKNSKGIDPINQFHHSSGIPAFQQ